MEVFILGVILAAALAYTARHIKRTLTVGEDGHACAACPLIKSPLAQKRYQAKTTGKV